MTDLKSDELCLVGGSWSGHLFENPLIGYPLTLSWTFTVNFAEVLRDDEGAVSPSLEIDWVPAGGVGLGTMAGKTFRASAFGQPIETSLYFFMHYRFDRVELVVESEVADELQVSAIAHGDLDGLGLDEVSVRAGLTFAGIYVPTDVTGTDPRKATELLASFTRIEGLEPRPWGNNLLFERAT